VGGDTDRGGDDSGWGGVATRGW